MASRATSFGYGKRWEPKNEKGRDSPPPTAYNPPSSFAMTARAIGFGNGPTAERAHTRSELSPGPGSYNPLAPLGEGSPKFSLRPRLSFKAKIITPSPGDYEPKFKLVEKSNFARIGFGYGERARLNVRELSPGPGTYEISSAFSKTNSRFFTPVRNPTPLLKRNRLHTTLDH